MVEIGNMDTPGDCVPPVQSRLRYYILLSETLHGFGVSKGSIKYFVTYGFILQNT